MFIFKKYLQYKFSEATVHAHPGLHKCGSVMGEFAFIEL